MLRRLLATLLAVGLLWLAVPSQNALARLCLLPEAFPGQSGLVDAGRDLGAARDDGPRALEPLTTVRSDLSATIGDLSADSAEIPFAARPFEPQRLQRLRQPVAALALAQEPELDGLLRPPRHRDVRR